MVGSIVVYGGLVVALVGLVNVARPWCVASRRAALIFIGAGLLLSLVGVLLPASEKRIAGVRTKLDEIAPGYQFNEVHSIEVNASCAKTYDAMLKVTPEEIRLFRTLVWIRRFGRAGRESILNPARNEPIMTLATRTAFLKLAEEPGREIVVGTIVQRPHEFRVPRPATPEWFKSLNGPGMALATMNFEFEESGAGCRVRTETRVNATSPDARRKFAAYWRVIYPGSALIRRMWLRAIKKRAEG
jgi:hypothetical protein